MRQIAGLFFSLAGSVIFMGIITAEIFYPSGYSIFHSYISSLGATPPPRSVSYQPSAMIFDVSMILGGILILVGATLIRLTLRDKPLSLGTVLLGVGALGVGVFPAFHAAIHPFFALVTFLAGGVSAILSSRVTKYPLAYFCVILGLISLVVLLLGLLPPHALVGIIGIGGTERWVAYPILLWLTVFGGFLMSPSKR